MRGWWEGHDDPEGRYNVSKDFYKKKAHHCSDFPGVRSAKKKEITEKIRRRCKVTAGLRFSEKEKHLIKEGWEAYKRGGGGITFVPLGRQDGDTLQKLVPWGRTKNPLSGEKS